MQNVAAMVEGLTQRLGQAMLGPREGRFTVGDQRVADLTAEVERLLSEVERPGAPSALSDEELGLLGDAARVLGQAAAVLLAAGEVERASSWLDRARELVPNQPDRAVFDEARQFLPLFRRLMQAQWHYAQADYASARKVAKSVLRDASGKPAISAVAESLANIETPLSGAPALMTLNGFGTRIYGQRDQRRDGSYIGTRYLTALFVPVLPLDAYRMSDAGAGRYYFHARAPLSRAAGLWRIVAAAALAVLAVGGGSYWYLTSPAYKLALAVDAAGAQAAVAKNAAQREAAIARYEQLIEQFGELSPDQLAPAVLGITRVLDASFSPSLPAADVDPALKALQRFSSIPSKLRAGEPTDHVCQQTLGLATALEARGTAGLYGARRLLAKAHRSCGGTVTASLRRVRLAVARLDTKDWPLLALGDYALALDADESIAESAKLIDAIADSEVSVWQELRPSLVSWVQAAKGLPEHRARAARVDERLAGAGAYFASPEREALGQEPKLDALTNAVAAQPGDQELRVALASHDADATALSTIAKAWTPGQMTRSTALAYADLLQRVGKLSEAESILEQLVQRLLPEYEDARADYAEASTAFYDKWYEKANEGQLPSDIEAELKGLSGERARQVFDKWLAKQADTDTDVRAHFEHAERASGVVPMVLSLGTVKLLLASQQTGEAQAQLLAAAERLFLAIRSDAGGLPAYHLGLAQVYYRLNKVADGEREFGELLSKDEPWLKLSVARAYREVGAISRAREVTEAVHAKSESPQREAAALLMSLMADSSDDQRAWLLRSDQQNTLVQTNLLELEANSACLDGKAQEGDRKYREAAQRHLQGSELNESNFNNAALAQAARVPCTGQRAPLDEAIGLMRRALRAAPDSSLLATNAAPLYEYRGQLRVLSRWLDASALQLDSHDTGTLIDALEDGEHREELLGALKDDPDVKQSRELSRNARVLAPTQPDAYGTEAAWLARFENYQGLAALLGVVRAQKLDTGPGTVKRKQWLEGQLDKSQRERLHKVEAKLGRLGAGLQSSSLAALRYLEAELALSLMVLDDPLPRAEQAVRAFEAAGQQWPALDARRRLAEALVVTAAVRASTTMPALATLLRAETRELGWFLMLSRLVDSSDPVLTTIKAQPEFARAMDIARQLPTDHPGSWDWLLARLGEDAPRADQLMARVFDANRRSTAELGRLLSPGRASDAYLAFLDLHAPKALAAH